MEAAVTALLGAAAGAITFDDEQFTVGRVVVGAVGQLAGERKAFEGPFAGRLAHLLHGQASPGSRDTFFDDALGFGGVFFEPLLPGITKHGVDGGGCHRANQFFFGLRAKLRIT